MRADSKGDVIVMGSSIGTDGKSGFCTLKYTAANGALLWERRYDSPTRSTEVPSALALDSAGNPVVTGSSISGVPPHDSEFYTAKYAAADGTLLWEIGYSGLANSYDGASALALGPRMVAVTGGSGLTSAGEGNYATVVSSENLPPVVTCPPNIVAISAGSDGVSVNFTVTATDDSGVAPAVACAPPSGSVFPSPRPPSPALPPMATACSVPTTSR